MFQKPASKLATHRPVGVIEGEEISANRHEQIDYIITEKGNLATTNCETDTRSIIGSDHYPVIAEVSIKLRENK